MSVIPAYSLHDFSMQIKIIFTLISVLIFIVSLSCTQYDQQYFDSMAELFAKESGANVYAICYGIYDNYTYQQVLDFHNTYIKNSNLADIYLYVFMDIKPENSKTQWGYGTDFGGVAVYDWSTGFIFWKPFDNDPKNLLHNGDIRKWDARNNVSAIWHEMMHLYYYKLGKSNYCYSVMVHKEYQDMNDWKRYDMNLNLVKPDSLLNYANKSYYYVIHPKPSCAF